VILLCGIFAGVTVAQPIQVERSNGSRLTIENYSEHLATALVFLSTRSPETRLAIDEIRAANDRSRRRGVIFAGIFPNSAELGEEMLRFCQSYGLIFPCYRDPERNATRALGATVTPEAFLLDGSGKVVYRGGIAGFTKALDDMIAKRPVSVASTAPSGGPIDRPGPALAFNDPHGSIVYSSELIFEKIPGAPVHHASSITEASNGDLLVTWYGGSYESSDDEALFLARRKKGQRN